MPRFLLAAVLCAATLAACGDEPRATPTPTTAADGSTVDDLAPADRFDALLEVGLPLLGLDIDDVTAGEGATFDDHVLATCDQASAVAAAVDREFATVGGSRAVAADQRFVAINCSAFQEQLLESGVAKPKQAKKARRDKTRQNQAARRARLRPPCTVMAMLASGCEMACSVPIGTPSV